MNDYTPSVDEVRDRYADARVGIGEWTRFDESVRRAVEDAQAEFDRMIAQVRAEALRNFADSIPGDIHDPRHVADLARGVADHIEKGAGL